ncbi:MAG TPA: TetR family transcriptional regulator [Sporichthyaceae bacterium]|jgi:AcrR family transcriptional regulator
MVVSLLSRALGERTADGAPEDSTTDRVLDAALRQFELFGVARSTVEQITKRSGLARVTLYRRFPGKQHLVEAVVLREVRLFLDRLDERLDQLGTPEEKIAEGFVFTLESIRSHVMLSRLLDSEPESVLRYFTTEGGPVVAAARDYLADRVARDFPEGRSGADLSVATELVVRLVISFLLTPQSVAELENFDGARAFAGRYLAPLLRGDGSDA